MLSNITQAAKTITRVLFVPNSTSTNVILYNTSVNKKLIFCYILNTILSVFAQFCQQLCDYFVFYYIGFVLFDCFLLPVLVYASFYFIFLYVKRFEMLLSKALHKIKCIIIINKTITYKASAEMLCIAEEHLRV